MTDLIKPYALIFAHELPTQYQHLKNMIFTNQFTEYQATIRELGVPQLLLIDKKECLKHNWIQPLSNATGEHTVGKHYYRKKFPKNFCYKFLGCSWSESIQEQEQLKNLIVDRGVIA